MLTFLGGTLPLIFGDYTMNGTHEQNAVLDTIANYIVYFGPPGKYIHLSPQTTHSGLLDSSIHFPEGPI